MPNRTEMLHFRATPEEKAQIEYNAEQVGESLSEWVRSRSLDRSVPTQPPVVEKSTMLSEVGTARTAQGNVVREDHPEAILHDEAYEQFMDRRVGELVGENPTLASQDKAIETAEREWRGSQSG